MNLSSIAQGHHFRRSAALNRWQNAVPKLTPKETLAHGPGRYCVYDESQEQGVTESAISLDLVETSAVLESSAAEPPYAETAASVDATAKRGVADRPWAKRDTSRNWFQRLLFGDSPEPRSGSRVAIPGLIAYFFTGGTPMPHEVSDISTSGIYIVTIERWYIGTIVRLTLSDRHDPKTERSLTVNAKVARFGNDGVGFEFLLDGNHRHEAVFLGPDYGTDGVDINRVSDFIETLRAA
jgi:hypothetical protein